MGAHHEYILEGSCRGRLVLMRGSRELEGSCRMTADAVCVSGVAANDHELSSSARAEGGCIMSRGTPLVHPTSLYIDGEPSIQ